MEHASHEHTIIPVTSRGFPLAFFAVLGALFGLIFALPYKVNTLDSVRAKDTWSTFDHVEFYVLGSTLLTILSASVAMSAGLVLGAIVGPARVRRFAVVLGPVAMLVAWLVAWLLTGLDSTLESGEAVDVLGWLILAIPVGLVVGILARKT